MDKIGQPMKACIIASATDAPSYSATTKKVPKPGPGQVLIKVEAGVVNPVDGYQLRNKLPGNHVYPLIPGFEGSGVVVGSGGNAEADELVGKRVGFSRLQDEPTCDGSFAEYCVTNAFQTFPLSDKVTFEQGACSFVNPHTAAGLFFRGRLNKAKAVMQNAAASQIGRMVAKLFADHNIPVINIVRRQEQVDLLKKDGAVHILNSSDADFEEKLAKKGEEVKPNFGIDALGGPEAGLLLTNLIMDGVMVNYGALSGKPISGIDPVTLIWKNLRLEATNLIPWLASLTPEERKEIQQLAAPLTQIVSVSKTFGLHQSMEALAFYEKNMTAGKVFLKPSLSQ